MRLKFVSGKKSIEFDGFGETDASITYVSGLEGVQKEYQTVKYVTVPGQVTLGEYVLPREVVVKGDIFTKASLPLSHYCYFFTEMGQMYVLEGTSRKKIAYKPVYFKTTGKEGDYVLFELKIICDFPYFSDSVTNSIDIYKRTDKVTGTFTLPKVFTERITEADLVNEGQVVSEPVITLECITEGTFSEGIFIKNKSTGKNLVLTINMLQGEIIEINVKKRTITSNMRQNCYGILHWKNALSEFCLQRGVNHIAVENQNDGEVVKADIYFENLYTEGM